MNMTEFLPFRMSTHRNTENTINMNSIIFKNPAKSSTVDFNNPDRWSFTTDFAEFSCPIRRSDPGRISRTNSFALTKSTKHRK